MWTMVRVQVFLLVLLIQTGKGVHGQLPPVFGLPPDISLTSGGPGIEAEAENVVSGTELTHIESDHTGKESGTEDTTVPTEAPARTATTVNATAIPEGKIRLVNRGGDTDTCSGRVEIFLLGQWGTVCDDLWDLKVAQVVCRQVGCGRAQGKPTGSARFGPGGDDMPIWIDDVSCIGNETELAQCKYKDPVGSANCGHTEDAGVVCAKVPKRAHSPPVPGRADRPPVPELICDHSQMEISLLQLTSPDQSPGLNMSSGHLADQSCSSFTERDGRVWYHVQPRADICGNMLTTNDTHATYSNSLFVYPANEGSTPMSFPFSCSYPMYTETSLDVAIRPEVLTAKETSSVGSQPNITVAVFRDANYTEPYAEGPVTLAVGSALHVQVSVEQAEGERFVVVLDDCYATHSLSPTDESDRSYYIRNMCPTRGRQVTVDENGSSLKARFSTLLFLFGSSHSDMFFHCTLHMCDQTTPESSCTPSCSRRDKRFAPRAAPAGLALKPMTFGPITLVQPLG